MLHYINKILTNEFTLTNNDDEMISFHKFDFSLLQALVKTGPLKRK